MSHAITRVWFTQENGIKSEHPTFGYVMRSNCDVTTIILNLYSICIQLLTAVNTYQRIFPQTFKTAVKTEHTRRTFYHALKSTLRLTPQII